MPPSARGVEVTAENAGVRVDEGEVRADRELDDVIEGEIEADVLVVERVTRAPRAVLADPLAELAGAELPPAGIVIDGAGRSAERGGAIRAARTAANQRPRGARPVAGAQARPGRHTIDATDTRAAGG
jgi:regulator of RNase E activity RraA